MGAQKVILGELEEKFGGSAAAAGQTFAGKLNIAKESAKNLAGNLVGALMPAFQTLVGVLSAATGWMTRHETATKVLVVAVAGLSAAVLVTNAAMKVATVGQLVLNAAMRANPIGIVITALAALGAGLVLAWRNSETFRNIVRGAFDAVKAAANTVLDFFRGNWRTIATLISGPFAPLVALATNAFGIRSALIGAFNAVRAATSTVISNIVGFFRELPGKVATAISSLGGKILGVIREIPNQVAGAAAQIGRGIALGIVNGIGDLAQALADKITGGISSALEYAKKKFGIGSPSTVAAQQLGLPLAQGVVVGWVTGSATLPDTMAKSVQRAITMARGVIDRSRAAFATAFGNLGSTASRMFAGVRAATMTPAEQQLAALTGAHDAQQQAQQLADAQGALSSAETPEARLAAQRQIDELLYQQQVTALQARAAAERVQQDELDAQRQAAFERALTALGNNLQRTGATTKTAMAKIKALLASYGVDFDSVGTRLGRAFVIGLRDAITAAARGAGGLSGAIRGLAAGIHVPALAAGGIVTRPTLALVGESGPEAVVPLARRAGGVGTTNHFHFHGAVGSRDDVIEWVREGLIRGGRRMPGVLGGLA
jgi:hypothetical protein